MKDPYRPLHKNLVIKRRKDGYGRSDLHIIMNKKMPRKFFVLYDFHGESEVEMRPCKIDSETFFDIFFVSVLYDCISVTNIGGCDRF